MWTCIRCQSELTAKDTLPSIDSFGVYFMCPVCGRRNTLRNISRRAPDAPLLLAPLDESD